MIALLLALVVAAATGAPTGTDLSYFVGSWNCSGTFSNGHPISSTLRFDGSLTGKGVILRQDDVPPNAYHAAALWGPAADGSLNAEIQVVNGSVYRLLYREWMRVGNARRLGSAGQRHVQTRRLAALRASGRDAGSLIA